MSNPKTKAEALYAANEARDSAIREHDIAQMASEAGEPTLSLLHRTRAKALELRAACLRALAPTLPSLPD